VNWDLSRSFLSFFASDAGLTLWNDFFHIGQREYLENELETEGMRTLYIVFLVVGFLLLNLGCPIWLKAIDYLTWSLHTPAQVLDNSMNRHSLGAEILCRANSRPMMSRRGARCGRRW